MGTLCRANDDAQACSSGHGGVRNAQGPALHAPLSRMAGVLAIAALACLVILTPAAYAAETITVSDQRTDAPADGDDILLQYDGFGLDVSGAVLGDSSFLGLDVEFGEPGAQLARPYLVITLLDDAFDPVFSDDYEILLVADAGPHNNFDAYQNRTLVIRDIPIGIDVVDLYLDRVPSADYGADGTDNATQADEPEAMQDTGDADESKDELADAPADDTVITDTPEFDDLPDAPDEPDADPIPGVADTESDGVITYPATGVDSDAHDDIGTVHDPPSDLVPDVPEPVPTADEPVLAAELDAHDACGLGTVLVDGVCVVDASSEPPEGDAPGAVPAASDTAPDQSGLPATGGRDLAYAAVAGFIAAGAISVALALMSRASRRRRAADAAAGTARDHAAH